ncbi:hypothetical protein GCM10020255_008030 [Rhodococcus baikonurensis]
MDKSDDEQAAEKKVVIPRPVEQALAGEIPSEALTVEEAKIFDRQLEARLFARLAATDLSLPENLESGYTRLSREFNAKDLDADRREARRRYVDRPEACP